VGRRVWLVPGLDWTLTCSPNSPSGLLASRRLGHPKMPVLGCGPPGSIPAAEEGLSPKEWFKPYRAPEGCVNSHPNAYG
jgi:hypothetical protein